MIKLFGIKIIEEYFKKINILYIIKSKFELNSVFENGKKFGKK